MPLSRTNQALAIPQSKSFDVVANIYGESAMLQLADVRQMSAAVEDVVTAGSFTFGNGTNVFNVAEAAAKPETTGTLSSYQLVAQKMATFVIVSEELLAESAVDIVSFYQDVIEQRFSLAIDQFALGLAGGPFGTENLAAAATAAGAGHTVVMTGTIAAPTNVHTAVASALGAVEGKDYAPNGILLGRRLKGVLRTTTTTGTPAIQATVTDDVEPMMYGEPVYFLGRSAFPVAAASTITGVVGDFSQFVIGIRDELSFSLHNEGTVATINLLETNQVALRAEMRLGAKVLDSNAFARINNAAA